MTYEAYINLIQKRKFSFAFDYSHHIMWLYLTFLLIIGAVKADHQYAWETGNEYHFRIESRTLTVLDKLAKEYSGIFMRGLLTVQVISSDTLQAVVSETQYASMNITLPHIWDKITDLEFQELSLSRKSFEIKLKNGVIQDVLVDQDVPTWEVNLLKSIVSQLQIDIQRENVIASTSTEIPNDNQSFGTFKVMEDSVGGKCEVLYNITSVSEYLPSVFWPHRKDNENLTFAITKTKNYTRCEQQMAYHSGIIGKMKPRSNDDLLSRSSRTRIVILGNLERFIILSSMTTSQIFINSQIHDTYSGAVYSGINLILEARMSRIFNPMPISNNLVSTGNLMYIYNNPFSSQPKPEPKLDKAPENLLLPYFIGYKGKSIQESEENYALVAAYLIGQITGEIEYLPVELLKHPFNETLERFITLVRLIRTMNVEQIAEVENKLPELFYQDNRSKFSNDENQKSYNQTVWDVLCHAVAHAGTGPAFITIKNWIKNGKLEGIQAARIISKIPKSALVPTAEYVTAFFELITDEQVTKQKFLNTTAPLSFAELVRYIQNNKSSIYYPVYKFGRTASKHNNALFETYIPYMATQLREAIKEGDSRRIQTYIMALGNFGHAKILSVFEPYLEGTLPASKFQRLMMVLSLSRLSENFPRIARSVAYKIYMNIMEAYELRCAAVFIIMKTNPSLAMLQRMAEFTNHDQDQHVNFVIMLNLDTLANLKEPEWKDLAGKARIASKLLNPDIYKKNYFQSLIEKINSTFLNYAQTSILQIIDSDDINIPKGEYIDIHSSIGFNLPLSKITYTISSIRNLLDMWYQMPWMIEDVAKKKLIIEEIVEKLGIKPEDAEQLEGNIFIDNMFALEFYPFDNNTIEEVINMFNTYVMISKTSTQFFEPRNMNHLNHYDMMMGFPTETGLPFIYTLTISTLRRISCGGSYKVVNSQTERFMELTAAGHGILNDKFQSRIGFITPFEHRHYIAGIDTNIQIFIPAGLSVKSEGNKKFELKILPREYYQAHDTNYIAIHHSVVPYIAKHDILDFQPVVLSNDTRLVHIEEPHEIKFLLGNLMFKAKSDCIDSNMSRKTGIEAFSDIYSALNKYDGAYYRRFDAILHLTSIAQVNITFDTFEVFINESSEATIPATFDKKPESDARKVQFLHEINKDINSAISQIIDMSILADNQYHIFTFASANSRVDNKFQVLFHWNVQYPSGKIFFEFCTVGYTRSSRIPLNFEKAIEKIPYYEFKAEMRVGSCASGKPIRFKGNWTRTDDAIETATKSEIVEECRQEIKQGNIWIPVCQRANKLVQQKDLLMMSTNMDSAYFLALVNRIFPNKMMIFNKNISTSRNIDNNTLDIEIKMPLDSYNANISLLISQMGVTFSVEDIIDVTLLKKYDNSEEATKEMCVLDKTQVVTFDNKVYPVKLGKCWHVMMTTYPKRDSNNPENTLNIPKNWRVIVMAREMEDGNKQIQMILGDQKIHLQKSSDRLEATVNGQIANFSHHESYQEDAFEIYELDEMIAVSSQQYDIYAVYDGERIILYLPFYKYLNAIRGLCGNFDEQSSNDFISPKNCILTKPEEFVATYALTQEDCQGPALQNKRKAEQSTCIFRSYHPTDVISDREAGRSSTRRPRYY